MSKNPTTADLATRLFKLQETMYRELNDCYRILLDRFETAETQTTQAEGPHMDEKQNRKPTDQEQDELIERLKLRMLSKETLMLMVADLAFAIEQQPPK